MYTQFLINEKGNITDIKVRAPHPKLKKEVFNIIQKPKFIPGKQNGKIVKTRYTLPISFEVE
ncbi:energy transducer TonB [Polaribacter batillariae]|uniref:Energy transducer TonB n=1 Tax=Polaribacter batillariae TaxID=2808900 RepID=A0ABX7T066_9FLAO|nr:energy transducer TonB [Polaribacter batillariae]